MKFVNFEEIWLATPFPAFVLNRELEILAASNSTENIFFTSKKQMYNQSLSIFVGENSVLMDAIRQVLRQKSSTIFYDATIFWTNKTQFKCNIYASVINMIEGTILICCYPDGPIGKVNSSLSFKTGARSITGMAAMLAHEILNPLAGISGAAQLLESVVEKKDHELIEIISDEAERIANLVKRMENFSELAPTKSDPVNIHDVLEKVKRASLAGYAKNLEITEHYDPSLPNVKGDKDQLLQAITNLVKNASESVNAHTGIIRFSTSFQSGLKLRKGSQFDEELPLKVVISDNGAGVPKNLETEIFEPFVTSKRSGSGLGLSLVSKIISNHSGIVRYDFRDGWAEFTILLPVWKDTTNLVEV